MKSSELILLLSLVAVATVAAHAGKPANRNVIIADSTANSNANSPQEDKPAEQANKNIQALKGLPNSQLLTVMHFMRTSLGVRCDTATSPRTASTGWTISRPSKSLDA